MRSVSLPCLYLIPRSYGCVCLVLGWLVRLLFFLLACLAGAGQPGREGEKEECELTPVIESDCFGWALEESLEDHGLRLRPRHEGCRHYRRSRSALLKDSVVAAMAAAVLDDVAEPGGLEGRKGGGGGVGETRTEKERRW